jgi:hypothetical protein
VKELLAAKRTDGRDYALSLSGVLSKHKRCALVIFRCSEIIIVNMIFRLALAYRLLLLLQMYGVAQ